MSPASDLAVEVRGLRMTYGTTVAVDDLDLTVARGSITAVLGPNGAGKTTTLETCEGYRRAQQGTVRVLGLDPQADRRALLPRVGVLPAPLGPRTAVMEPRATVRSRPSTATVRP